MKNLEAAARVVTALCRLIGNAVAMKTDISDADFKDAMTSYDAAKRKLADMMREYRESSGGGGSGDNGDDCVGRDDDTAILGDM